MKRFVKLLAAALIITAPIALFVWLFLKDLTPSGVLTINHSVTDASPFIDRFLPDTRAINGEVIVDEPVYAAVHLPGDFETVTVDLFYENAYQPIVQVGFLASEDPLQYVLEPLQNLLIDRSEWDRIDAGGLVLLQRYKVFESIDTFLADPPLRGTIATFNTSLTTPYRIPDYYPTNTLQTIDTSLRGYHEFLTYVKNEPLLVQAEFQDMNRDFGEDPVELLVFNEENDLVGSQSTLDDGVIEATAKGSTLRSTTVVLNDLPEGVYKVILKAPRDIFFRKIMSRQRYLTFVGPIFFGDDVGYRDDIRPVDYFTDAKHVSFFTYHADAAQKVTIGASEVRLPEAQVRYDHDVTEAGLVAVHAPASDFTFTHDGKVAFRADQFFNPDPVNLSWNTDLDALGVNFVLADYTSPPTEEGIVHAQATFDLQEVMTKDGEVKLVLSAPGIRSLQQQLTLRDLQLTFERPQMSGADIWNKLREFLTFL